MSRLATVTVLAAASLAVACPAFATKGHGHTPVVVCHNVTHNPHLIVVDDDSTKLHAHLAHRTQTQLMDLVEGVDGTAAQIRAACVAKPVPSPTSIPTTTPTEVPSSTTTTATSSTSSSTSTTTSSSATPTSTGSAPTPKPSPDTSTTRPPSSAVTPPVLSSTRVPSTVVPSASGNSPKHSATSPSSTVAPPELAHTGSPVGFLLALGGVFLVFGGFAHIARKGTHREH